MSESTPSSGNGRRRPGRRALIALAGLGAALIVAVPIAWASHQFTDVPDSSPFHDDIAAVKNAGVTSGKTCAPPGTPPTYCPGEGITREAMAAFLHRGLGRVAYAYLPPRVVPSGIPSVPASWTVDLAAGGVAGQTGFVKIDAVVNINNLDPSPTPRLFVADLKVDGADVMGNAVALELNPDYVGVVTLTAAAPVSTGAVHTVSVAVGGGGGVAAMDGNVTVTYYPFGSIGPHP